MFNKTLIFRDFQKNIKTNVKTCFNLYEKNKRKRINFKKTNTHHTSCVPQCQVMR